MFGLGTRSSEIILGKAQKWRHVNKKEDRNYQVFARVVGEMYSCVPISHVPEP